MFGQVDRQTPLSPRSRERLITMTCHFFLVVSHDLRLSGPGLLLVVASDAPSALMVVNPFCSWKPLGGAGAFTLVPEDTSFHSALSPEVLLTLMVGVDTVCFSTAE